VAWALPPSVVLRFQVGGILRFEIRGIPEVVVVSAFWGKCALSVEVIVRDDRRVQQRRIFETRDLV
jgi:hypothetical protein